MSGEDNQEVSEILRQAQDTKWAYSKINEFWEALPDPLHYGDRMAEWLPDSDYIHKLLLDTLQSYLPSDGKLLDLGAGSGRVSKMILERFPECHVTLVDAAQNMLSAAAQKLAPYTGRYVIQQGDFFDDAFAFPPASFNAVIAVFAICHGRHTAHYAGLYEKIQQWLKPGGLFLCLDHILGTTEAFTALNVSGWWNYLETHFPQKQVREFVLNTYQEDHPLPLSQHLQFLAAAGFQSKDILYKRDIFAVYTAVKTVESSSDSVKSLAAIYP